MPTPRPNILFAITDDWSFGHAGAYGCPWVDTPAFDRVAREGLLFSQAYTVNAKCAPSRATLLTGLHSWQLKEAGNHAGFFPPEFKVYPEVLEESGYFTGSTNKGWAPGVALQADGSPRRLVGRAFDARTCEPPSPRMNRCDYAANFEDFLAAAPAGRPWCFWYGSSDPHRAYEPGSGARRGGRRPEEIERVPAYWPDNDTVRHDLLDYGFAVEHFDRHLGRMLAALDRTGAADNTIVVVTSDHAMPFPRAKGQPYPFSTHVPLAIRWPAGIAGAGRIVSDFVSHVDIAPTLLQAAGLEASAVGMAPPAGRSLGELLAGHAPAVPRDAVYIGQERHDIGRPGDVGYPVRGIIERDWVYLRNFEPDRWPACNPETGYLNCDGSPTKTHILQHRLDPAGRRHWELCFGKRPAEELYDLRRDPDCLENLAPDAAHAAIRDRLRDRLFATLRETADPRVNGRGAVFDAYLVARPEMRGFYEKWQRGEAPYCDWVEPSDFAPLT
ncbi:sulfatase [Opitutus sp. ER46]|uniref:sulfatase family protein n=1 Tax=Opitutus sp. ER46 TaxID=2161864 RepID=UPI0018EE9B9E|nr:sulfatase [Opitutus sp. ER46]